MLNYFDISAEASNICSHLLKTIKNTLIFDDYYIILNNPFANPNKHEFELIRDSYSSLLHGLKSMRKRVARKVKLIKYFKKFLRFRFLGSGLLSKVGKQIDVAAKGTYILNRDFDTLSRLVARLHDEVEHKKAMVRFCWERREDKFCLQVVKEIKKSDVGFRKQVQELEEHVYLCLVTINRARALVIREMTSCCVQK